MHNHSYRLLADWSKLLLIRVIIGVHWWLHRIVVFIFLLVVELQRVRFVSVVATEVSTSHKGNHERILPQKFVVAVIPM